MQAKNEELLAAIAKLKVEMKAKDAGNEALVLVTKEKAELQAQLDDAKQASRAVDVEKVRRCEGLLPPPHCKRVCLHNTCMNIRNVIDQRKAGQRSECKSYQNCSGLLMSAFCQDFALANKGLGLKEHTMKENGKDKTAPFAQ